MARQNDSDARTQNPKLRERLQTIVPRILKDRDRRIGEQNTKAMLIEPVLEALGWDIRDWDEVHREYRGKSVDNPVDYALKIMRTPRMFLEAKGLGEDMADRKWVAQVLGYATMAGVEWCVLTDGDEWRFYNSTAAVDADEKLFRRVRLSDGNLDDAMATLLLLARDNIEGNLLEPLWAAHFVDRRVKQAMLDMLESCDKGLVRLLHRKVPKLQPKQITDSLGRLDVRIDSPAVRPAVATKPSSPESQRETPIIDVEALRLRRQAGESLGALASEVGLPWQSLWAMLKIPGTSPKPSTGRAVTLADLIAADVFKAPARLFSKYKGRTFEATLLADGQVEFQGQRYGSPSAAGGAACATVTGRKMSTDGWMFWKVEGDDGRLRELTHARSQFIAQMDAGKAKTNVEQAGDAGAI